jgi:hypothetical protein
VFGIAQPRSRPLGLLRQPGPVRVDRLVKFSISACQYSSRRCPTPEDWMILPTLNLQMHGIYRWNLVNSTSSKNYRVNGVNGVLKVTDGRPPCMAI